MRHPNIEDSQKYKELQVVQSNDFITTVQPVSLNTKKLLCYEISWIKRTDSDFSEHTYTIKDIANIIGVPAEDKNIYKTVAKIRNELMNNKFLIVNKDADIEIVINLMSFTKKTTHGLTLKLNNDLKDFLLHLNNGNFTRLDRALITRFKSYYGLRLYEILQANLYKSHIIQVSVPDFRKYMNCENKYPQIQGLRTRVLDVAVKDIAQATSDVVSYTLEKTSGVYDTITFIVSSSEAKRDTSGGISPEDVFR